MVDGGWWWWQRAHTVVHTQSQHESYALCDNSLQGVSRVVMGPYVDILQVLTHAQRDWQLCELVLGHVQYPQRCQMGYAVWQLLQLVLLQVQLLQGPNLPHACRHLVMRKRLTSVSCKNFGPSQCRQQPGFNGTVCMGDSWWNSAGDRDSSVSAALMSCVCVCGRV